MVGSIPTNPAKPPLDKGLLIDGTPFVVPAAFAVAAFTLTAAPETSLAQRGMGSPPALLVRTLSGTVQSVQPHACPNTTGRGY